MEAPSLYSGPLSRIWVLLTRGRSAALATWEFCPWVTID